MKQKVVYIVSIILSLFVGIAGTVAVYRFVPVKHENVERVVKEVSITEANTIKSSVEKVYDSVVMVESYRGTKAIGSGSGFVYKKDDKKGYIITNQHVIDGADNIKVVNAKGQELTASLLGSDVYSDIAVLSIDKEGVLKVAEVGDSTKLELGDTLFTIGTPLGREYMGTLTKGVVSGVDRTVTVNLSNNKGSFMMEVIQTDAAMNPGNSGGPLVNINGEVIGVNSMKLVKDEIEGMGFAIPIEMVMATVDRLEKGEEIKRPMLGVELLDVDNTYALYLNHIILPSDVTEGVVVVNVTKNSPAAVAGLQSGDVIIEMNGKKASDTAHFRFLLYKCKVGDTIKVKYMRDNKILEASIKLTKSIEDD